MEFYYVVLKETKKGSGRYHPLHKRHIRTGEWPINWVETIAEYEWGDIIPLILCQEYAIYHHCGIYRSDVLAQNLNLMVGAALHEDTFDDVGLGMTETILECLHRRVMKLAKRKNTDLWRRALLKTINNEDIIRREFAIMNHEEDMWDSSEVLNDRYATIDELGYEPTCVKYHRPTENMTDSERRMHYIPLTGGYYVWILVVPGAKYVENRVGDGEWEMTLYQNC